jgi:hypothetical protein
MSVGTGYILEPGGIVSRSTPTKTIASHEIRFEIVE